VAVAANFTANINAGKRVTVVANLPAVAIMLTVGREIHIDQYVYQIPREYRNASIVRENRESAIRRETRTHIIQGT
jgi:hypothetical protein